MQKPTCTCMHTINGNAVQGCLSENKHLLHNIIMCTKHLQITVHCSLCVPLHCLIIASGLGYYFAIMHALLYNVFYSAGLSYLHVIFKQCPEFFDFPFLELRL